MNLIKSNRPKSNNHHIIFTKADKGSTDNWKYFIHWYRQLSNFEYKYNCKIPNRAQNTFNDTTILISDK